MKLVIVLAVVVCSYAAKLDRTYLPPPGAASAGGSPGSLTTPNRPGSRFDQSGTPSNGRDDFDLSDASASINNRPSTSYNHTPQGITGGSNINVQTPAATNFRTPSAGIGGHSSQSSKTPHSIDNSVSSGFGNDQEIIDHNNENNQSYGNQDSTAPERLQAAADRAAETIRYDSKIDGDSFAYSFETSNGISAEESGVATNGVQAQGGFSYIGDDGQQYKVTYTANENGYLPQGDHLPTPPPIPDEILRSIEENARAAAAGTQEGAYHEDDNSSTANDPTKEFIQYQMNTQNIPNVETSQLGNEPSQSEPQKHYPSSSGSISTTGRDNSHTPTRPSTFSQPNSQSSLSDQQNGGSHTTNIGQQEIPTFTQQNSQSGYNYNRPAASQSFDSRPSQSKDIVSDRPQQNNFATSGNDIYQYNTPKPQSQQQKGPQSQNTQQSASNYQTSQPQRPQYSAPKSPAPAAHNSQFSNSQSIDSKYISPKPQIPQFTPSRPQKAQYVAPSSQIPQYTTPKNQFSQYSTPNQGSNQQTPQYTAPKYQENQNIPQSQSPKYSAPQYSTPYGQKTQFNAPQPQPSQNFSPQNPQYSAPQSQSPKYTAPKQQVPQSSASNVENTQFNAPQAPSSSRPQNPQYSNPQSQSPKYSAPQYSTPVGQKTQFNAPQPQPSQNFSPQNPQYSAPQSQSPKYTAPKQQAPQYSASNAQNTQFSQTGSPRPQVPQYNQQQPQTTKFAPTKPQLTQQYASNKGYQYNAPTGPTFEEPRPSFNNQTPNSNGSPGKNFNNGLPSSPENHGAFGGGTVQYQPTTASPNFVPLGQKNQTPGEDFSGPRQPPSFSPEEGYRY